jgi:hypothetical protein
MYTYVYMYVYMYVCMYASTTPCELLHHIKRSQQGMVTIHFKQAHKRIILISTNWRMENTIITAIIITK